MKHQSSDASKENSDGSRAIRTVSDARQWLAKLARDGASEVCIQEPFQEVGDGLVIVRASLVREDGARIKVEVYCYDDAPRPSEVDWLPPIPGGTGSRFL